jgi:hypothetical protein
MVRIASGNQLSAISAAANVTAAVTDIGGLTLKRRSKAVPGPASMKLRLMTASSSS